MLLDLYLDWKDAPKKAAHLTAPKILF